MGVSFGWVLMLVIGDGVSLICDVDMLVVCGKLFSDEEVWWIVDCVIGKG